MISLLANLALTICVLINIILLTNYAKKYIWPLIITQSSLILFSFSCLIIAFIISDFSVANVYFNSSTLKPLIFKISAVWSSHEGSLLLWICLYSLAFLAFSFYLKKNNFNLGKLPKIFYLTNILFLLFLLLTANPFIHLINPPSEGLGLNPLLQDQALSFHPPLIYLSYAVTSMLFFAACIFNYNEQRQNLLSLLKFFGLTAWTLLTIGILTGSWWAYRELGWGGVWYFDPVENASLMPWLTLTALIHNFYSKQNYHLLIIFSLLSFICCIFAFFLVRSGLLVSVHSFAAASDRGMFALAILLIISIYSIFYFYRNFISFSFSNRKFFLNILSYLLIFCLLIIVITIIYPFIFNIVTGQSISFEANYYIKNFLPPLISCCLLAGLFSFKDKLTKSSIINSIIALILALINFYYFQLNSYISLFALFSAFIIILQIVSNLIINYSRFNLTMNLAHFGLALIIIGLVFSSELHHEENLQLTENQDYKFLDFDLNYKKVKYKIGQNYYSQFIELNISQDNNYITSLKPEERLYIPEKRTVSEIYIYSCLSYDLYAALTKVNNNIAYVNLIYKPLISLVWLGGLFLIAGPIISLTTKRIIKFL